MPRGNPVIEIRDADEIIYNYRGGIMWNRKSHIPYVKLQ